MPNAKLIDNQTGKHYDLINPVFRIGRNADNDIVVKSRMVSKYHVEIQKKITGFHVVDPGSKHGCYVNNDRVKKLLHLHDGDRIRVLIIFSDDEAAQMNADESGTKTLSTKAQAVAKSKLDGSEKNVNVVCDYTFRQEGIGVIERLAQIFAKR
ncbi:MAG: FHA domain-containing protein [Planctomycetes bacterium]|nr:FHA domain-containing protein [Planctomycetota bacterium]